MGLKMQPFAATIRDYKTLLVFLFGFMVRCIIAEKSLMKLSMPDVRPTHVSTDAGGIMT
jgi:hypothetical protein